MSPQTGDKSKDEAVYRKTGTASPTCQTYTIKKSVLNPQP